MINKDVRVEDDEVMGVVPDGRTSHYGSSDGDGLGECTIIGGNLWISGNVTSLRALDHIEEIRGMLIARISGGMTVFEGLNRVRVVGSWITFSTDDGVVMDDFAGLNSLREAENISLGAPLKRITGLQSLVRVARALNWGDETEIESFPGLRNLEEAGEISLGTVKGSLSDFASLRTVHGTFSINSSHELERYGMPALEVVEEHFAITGARLVSADLPRLSSVGGKLSITSTQFRTCDVGLGALRSVGGDLWIRANHWWPGDCVTALINQVSVAGQTVNCANFEQDPCPR